MYKISVKRFGQLLNVLASNYYASVIVLLIASLVTLSGNDIVFHAERDLYGPLVTNLYMMLLYLALIDIALSLLCCIRDQYHEIIMLGTFYILIIGSLEFYSKVNQVPLSTTYHGFFLYIAISHIAYGIIKQSEHNTKL